jgi:DNA-binding CsgD family transcriptional regulator
MTLKEAILFLRKEGRTFDQIKYVLMCSKSTISYHVSEGQKEKTRNRTSNARAAIRQWLKEEKEKDPCTDCGRFYKYYVMHFDHLPEFEKLFNLAAFKEYTGSLDIVKAERAKCDLVCGNCHAERTHRRLHPGDDWDDDIFESELG